MDILQTEKKIDPAAAGTAKAPATHAPAAGTANAPLAGGTANAPAVAGALLGGGLSGANVAGGLLSGGLGPTLGGLGRGLGETLEKLIDPVGVADRAQAKKDLAGKFQVIDKDYKGPKLPNMVTQEEFDKVARNYSDIRLGRSDLKIDGSTSADPKKYKADMMNDIATIMQTESGRKLVGKLSDNVNGVDAVGKPIHRTTTLLPRLGADGKPDNSNAGESGDSSPGVGSPFADGKHGVGGDTTIAMNPGMDVVAGGGTFRSDVALYHEMVHAMHDTAGTTDSSQVTEQDSALREFKKGNFSGGINEILHPDAGVASDAAFRRADGTGLNRYEHQAAGLGLYKDDPITENRYRAERNAVALSGKGAPGDLLMPQRDRYVGYSGTYTPFFGL